MKKRIKFLISTFISLSLGSSTFAQNYDSLFTYLHKSNQFNGNVLIAEGSQVTFAKSYGYAHFFTKELLNRNTQFELASVSKSFTAFAIRQLHEKGKLNVKDPMGKYLPELAFYGDISLENLIFHTSGLPDYMSLLDQNWDKTKFATNQDIVNVFAQIRPPLNFPIGSKFEYSNTGYALLGLIIEKASGQSYGEYLKINVFVPLKMLNTEVYQSRYSPKEKQNYAYGYVTDSLDRPFLLDSLGKSYYTYFLDGIVGDGMVNSTVDDLLIWAKERNKLLKDAEVLTALSPDVQKEYKYGWSVANDKICGKIVSHSGGWAAYTTYLEIHPDHDKVFILLQNVDFPNTVIPYREVRKLLYGIPLPKSVAISEEELLKYIGSYKEESLGLILTVFVDSGILKARAEGQSAFPLVYEGESTFRFDQVNIKMTFKGDELILKQNGQEFLFKK